MKQVEKIWSELSANKVELNVVNDLKKYPKGYNKYSTEGEGLVKKAIRINSELKDLKKALYKWAEVGNSISADIVRDLNTFEEKVKDLGIKPDSQTEYSNAVKVISDYKKSVARYEEAARNISI